MSPSRYSVGSEAAVKELMPDGAGEVEKEGTAAFDEDAFGRGEARGERIADFRADFTAAGADAGAHGREEDLWGCAEVAEGLDGACGDAGRGAAPSAVDGGDGAAVFRGDEEDGAVGREAGEGDGRCGGDKRVNSGNRLAVVGRAARRVLCGHHGGFCAVDLLGEHEAGGVDAHGGRDTAAVFGYLGARFAPAKVQIEIAALVIGAP